jgi:hypothetical protein
MKGLFRLSLCAGLGGVLLIGASRACPAWTARLGLNFRGLVALEEQMTAEQRRSAELDRQSRLVFPRVVAKCRAGAELASGRLSLLEAAARFRALDRITTGGPAPLFHQFYPGSCDEERYCRQAIHFLKGGLYKRAEDAALMEQLEAELTDHLAHGTLHLPEAGPGFAGLPRGDAVSER